MIDFILIRLYCNELTKNKMNGIYSYIKGRFFTKWDSAVSQTIKYVSSDENLQSLYHAMKSSISGELDEIAEADRKHVLSKSIFQILEYYGTPLFITHTKYGKAVHETAHYKKRFFGYKTSIVYHFVDKKLIAVMYCIKYSNNTALKDLHQLVIQQFGIDIHKNDFAGLKDGRGNLIQYNTQHDLRIDIFNKPNHVIPQLQQLIKKSGAAVVELPKVAKAKELELQY